MSAPEPDLPRDPAEYRRKPLLGVGFWASIAFGVLAVLAGAGVVLLGPRLLPPKPQAPVPASPAPASVAAPAPPLVAAPAAAPDEIARLNARIAALESQGARTSEAATAALAAAALLDAAQSSRPFPAELAALRRAAPNLPELAALSRLADTGAPSRAALAASFPPFAARAASRARKPGHDAGLGERIAYAAGKVVTIRQLENVSGQGPDALLARAERALSEGDVVRALKILDGLPPRGHEALAPWRDGAERRAGIDREIAALRARAMKDLDAPEAAT